VLGASAFPQNGGYNPTGTVAALAFWAADAIRNRYLQKTRDGSSMRSIGSLARSVVPRALVLQSSSPAPPRFAGASDPQEFTQIERAVYLASPQTAPAAIPSRK